MRLPARLLAVLTMVLASAGGLLAAEAADAGRRKVRLRLPYSHQFQFAGAYAAEAKGFFRERGLEVEIISSRSEKVSPIEDVLSGQVEFGILQGPQLVAARLDGRPVVVLAAIMQHSPQALVVRAESGIRTPHDLVGKRVALDQTSLVSEVRMMLEREGIAFDQITVVQNRWDRNELLTGEADAMSTFVIDGPHVFRKAGVPINLIRPVDYGVDFYGDCLFTTEARLREERALVESMRAAMVQGWDYALRNPTEIVDWIVTHLPDRPEYATRELMLIEAREVSRLINADLVEIGHMNPGRWQAMAMALRPEGGEAQLKRLEGFLHEREEQGTDVLKWVWWVLMAALLVALLSLLMNRRLHRLVEQRTGELRVKEEHYRLLFERSPVALIEFDYRPLRGWFAELRAQGVQDLAQYFAENPDAGRRANELSPLREVNAATLRAVGAASREEMFRRLPEIVTPLAIEARLHNMVRLWQGHDHAEGEISYRHLPSGEIRYFYYHWRMPREPDGRLSFENTQTALLEVTAKHEAEQALRESEERYRRLFEATPVPMWIYDLESLMFLDVNEAAVRSYGYSREEFLAMSILDIRPEEERERLRQVVTNYVGSPGTELEFAL